MIPALERTGGIRFLGRTILGVRHINIAAAPAQVLPRFISHLTPVSKAAGTNIELSAANQDYVFQPHRQSEQSTWINPGQQQFQRQSTKPGFYQAIAQILRIRERYIQDRTIFVRGEDMLSILLGLGASHEDVEALPLTSNDLVSDPTLPFRTTANSRFCFDWDARCVRRMEHQPFMLSEDEDFMRYDSGRLRNFDEVSANVGQNSAFLALLVFKAIIINGIDIVQRRNLNYNSNKWVCTAFHIRTHTTPNLLGEPALEGVHSDGVDHTLVTFLGSKNTAPNSAATFLHSMDEITGIPVSASSPMKIVGFNRHSAFLDTLMIVDHERKHSLTPVYAEDPNAPATRDVLIFFSRRPYLDTHVAASFDSLEPHPTLGVQVPLIDFD